MRLVVLLIAVSLSGCVGEFLGPSDVTARTVMCHVMGTEPVVIEHHAGYRVPTASAAEWIEEMARISGTELDRFSQRIGPAAPEDMELWLSELEVLGDATTLHLVWLSELPGPEIMEIPTAGVLLINQSALTPATERPVLFHGLGHAIGLVNLGTPMNSPDASREMNGHEAEGLMAEGWHRVATMPAEAPETYSDAVVADLRAAAVDPRICP